MFHSLMHGLSFSFSTQTQVLICPNWWFLYECDLACNFLNESGISVIRIFSKFIFNCHLCGTSCVFGGHSYYLSRLPSVSLCICFLH